MPINLKTVDSVGVNLIMLRVLCCQKVVISFLVYPLLRPNTVPKRGQNIASRFGFLSLRKP